MPRIEKVRITGVRYDKMKKHYENTIFDFINDEEPQHALLTLVNGGGKGMLLQMLFQTMMPLTTWGKNGENQIDALFYNEKLQFDPYTFHVALEWRLDTDPAEWLLTGICVTASRYGQERDENETEPQYFLYTSKYRKPEAWTIETIPVFDEKNNHSTSFEEWEGWLKKHKQQFHLYTKTKQHAYYQYLSSYSIERSEWRHMKEINRDEGGIEHYFKKGLDNFGLFHHLIIPEISHYLEEDQEENLLKIFRDNSIIAQKLPKLLKREDGYNIIREKLVPIKNALEEGQLIEMKIQEHFERAHFFYFGMEESRQSQLHDQEKWEQDKQNTEKLRDHFLWQQENLAYAKECRSYEQILQQKNELENQQEQLKTEMHSLKFEEHKLQIDIALTDYLESTNKLNSIKKQIKLLEDSQNLEEEKEQIEEIEQQLAVMWKKIETELNEDYEAYHTLQHNLQKEINGLKSQISLHTEEKVKLNSQIGTCTDHIKAHNKKAIAMDQKYGKDTNRDPELVRKRFVGEFKELEEKFEALQTQNETELNRKMQIGSDIGESKGAIRTKKKEIEQQSKQMKERLKAEQSFHREWCRFQQEEQEFQIFTGDDLADFSQQMNSQMDRLKAQLGNVKKEYWYHQLDTTLVHPEYWIPNNDVRKLVDTLAEQGVQASYGTQLLWQFSEEERETLIKRFPLLVYGLVIHQNDWDNQVNQPELSRILLHSPVPIFIRERMNQDFSAPYEVVYEQGMMMAVDANRWERWKENLSKKTAVFIDDIERLEGKLTESSALYEKIKALQTTNYLELESEHTVLKQQLQELNGQQSNLLNEKSTIEALLLKLSQEIKSNTEQQNELRVKLHELAAWVEAHNQIQEYHRLKSEAHLKLNQVETRLSEANQQHESEVRSQTNWSNSFNNWLIRSQIETEKLKKILTEIQFPSSMTISVTEGKTPAFRETIFIEAVPFVTRWENLQQKIHSITSELASERTKLEYAIADQQEKKNQLVRLDPAWDERVIPSVPKAILVERQNKKSSEIDNATNEINSINGRVQKRFGQLEQIEKSKRKIEHQILKKHRVAADSWVDENLDEKDIEIEQTLDKLNQDLCAQQKIIAELVTKQLLLQKQQEILKSHLASVKQVGEIPIQFKEQIKVQPEKLIHGWIAQNNVLKRNKEDYQRSFKELLKQLSLVIQDETIDAPLRNSMNQLITQLESDSIRSGLSVVSSVLEHIQLELLKLKEDKQTAEKAQEVWVNRAVYRVIRIIQSLKRMVNRMKIKNKEGHWFPLVEIERLNEILATEEEEYRRLLREHFAQTIGKLLETEESIENLSDAQLKKYIDDSQLVLVSLRNRYPILHIYKPQTTNAFLYDKPRKHHYTTWETLNKGSKVEAKGSGGQLLAARTMIMMMIMTFKRQEQSSNWSVLITDNPFGQAVSAHILDPIFSIADILRFQWIVLAPPELIKLDVSRRFPVYWKLELNQQKRGEVINEVLQHGGRTFDEVEWSLF